MRVSISFVNAFTDTLFKGNSAAVIITPKWLDVTLMQAIATENNLSETAFLVKSADDSYAIRWFSPIKEIAFCGHATLAAAFVLFSNNQTITALQFSALAVGSFSIKKMPDAKIQMNFPQRKPQLSSRIPESLFQGLSIEPQEVWYNNQAYFAVYDNEDDVRQVTTDNAALKRLAPFDVVVTAAARQYDFISRYFWPASGGDEDPVTGSIHAGLMPFWGERLGKKSLVAFQASKRGGILYGELAGDRVLISGHAVQYMEGTIDI